MGCSDTIMDKNTIAYDILDYLYQTLVYDEKFNKTVQLACNSKTYYKILQTIYVKAL